MSARSVASTASVNRPLWAWLLIGLLGYLLLPWYAQQDANGLMAVGQVFGAEPAANGLLQAALYGRPWLWLGLVGLAIAGVGAAGPAGRRQGAVLALGGALGLLALLLAPTQPLTLLHTPLLFLMLLPAPMRPRP